MRMNIDHRNISTLGAAGLVVIIGTVSSQAGTLRLELAGEAYEGAPGFAVSANDVDIGSGLVARAIDTETSGRLTADNMADHTEGFSFDFEDAAAGEGIAFALRLTTDAYGGPGSGLDQNLFVVGLSVDGRAVPLEDMTLSRGDVTGPVSLINGTVPLYKYTDVLRYVFGGPVSAEAGTVEPPVEAEAAGEVEVPSEVAADADTGVLTESEPAMSVEPAAEVMPEALDAAALSAAPVEAMDDVQAEPVIPIACPVGAVSISITGFAINSPEVPEGVAALLALNPAATDCVAVVTGYSSLNGPAVWNAKLSEGRAKAVADMLAQTGLPDDRIRVVAGEATDQFGPDAASNQRVVMSFEAASAAD